MSKKQTRMMALWDGISDAELRYIINEGTTRSHPAIRRASGAAERELERREKAMAAKRTGPAPTKAHTDEVELVNNEDRWCEFSDDELELFYGALIASQEKIPERLFALADVTASRLYAERVHREQVERSRPTYQGPGYYRNLANGTIMHVVRSLAINGKEHALVGRDALDPNLWALPMEKINARNPDGSGGRLYEFSETGP